jgi:FkbM family methyltransferase
VTSLRDNPAALAELLAAERLTAVVDIGANPTDGYPPYYHMLQQRLCTVIGFEPQAAEFEMLMQKKGDLETYLPYAVGDGSTGTLNICQAPGMSSLLMPDSRALDCFPFYSHFGTVHRQMPVETRTLDSMSEIKALDYLKIDVQGSELSIFRNARSLLSNAVVVQTEVSFVQLYEGQPGFGEIDTALRALGFIPHMIHNIERRMILPIQNPQDRLAHINQILEGDMVYVRDFTRGEKMSVEQLKHLAMVAHYCYGSFDLTGNCIYHLIRKGALPPDSVARYLELIPVKTELA